MDVNPPEADLNSPPPIDPETDFDEAPPTSWPRVIGIISLIYAILGLFCGIGGGLVQSFMSQMFLRMGGIDVQTPPAIKVLGMVTMAMALVLGLILLFAAINLLRRRRLGVTLHKAWVVIRLILLLAGVAGGIYMIPTQVDFQRQITDAVNEMQRQNGGPERDFNENAVMLQQKIGIAVISPLFAVYPLFIGFFLARRKIADEVSGWD